MDDFIARQPILNMKAQVYGYQLKFGQNTGKTLNETRTGYSEFGRVTQSMFFKTLKELSDHTPTFLEYSEELAGIIQTYPPSRETASSTVIVFSKDSSADADLCQKLKSDGFQLAFDSAFFTGDSPEGALADIVVVEFTSKNLIAQSALIRKFKGHKNLLASKVETWSDFKVAKDMGYELFSGFFFLWPSGAVVQKEIKSLDVCLITILSELEKPEPNFRNISETIEHDLGLSYKLLRLVNSAYMAPKYKIKSISQALTYLGTRELHQWISMLMFNGIKSDENSELVVMSLIRGKMMALAAQELQIAQAGAEPFFTGLFSLIDVILNRDLNTILTGLPLPDDIKTALLGGGNTLAELLDFIVSYEQADWKKVEGKYPMTLITPQRMAALYIEAHNWARLVDHPV
jgi:EAL and modified HD-GYP domain-containing signal transduction protein